MVDHKSGDGYGEEAVTIHNLEDYRQVSDCFTSLHFWHMWSPPGPWTGCLFAAWGTSWTPSGKASTQSSHWTSWRKMESRRILSISLPQLVSSRRVLVTVLIQIKIYTRLCYYNVEIKLVLSLVVLVETKIGVKIMFSGNWLWLIDIVELVKKYV